MTPLAAVNDFVVKFANVNGSGSASANGLFAKAILRMGVPVAARNIFPSNIQGLPTWFEVRVSEAGWLGRRGGGVDLMVAMNPQTFAKDIAGIEPGGYLFYNSSKPLHGGVRDDVTVLGLPLTTLCNAHYSLPRERQLFKNIIYVGALAQLLGIEEAVTDALIAETFAAKRKLIDANLAAVALGRRHAAESLPAIGLELRRADKIGERIYVDGNTAAGLGAVFGGASVCAWYPITPSTSLAEAFTNSCQRLRLEPETDKARFAIVQAEDEIASIGMVIGAGWNGARAFTCTSGPGISLMQEFIGLSYFAEIPAVIFDVQRGGPSTGMPTRTQQSDILIAAYASHGDTKHPLLLPEDPAEAFAFAALAFDLAERLQTCIFVMLDLDIGMNDWLCRPFALDPSRQLDRGKLMSRAALEAGTAFGRYRDVDDDGIPWRTLPGTHPSLGAFFTRGTSRDPDARYSEEGPVYVANMERLLKKFETAKALVPAPVERPAARRTPHAVIYYGSTSPAMDEALALLAERGLHLDAMRLRAFPFAPAARAFIAAHETVFIVEQNRDAQMRALLINEEGVDPAKLAPVLNYDGAPITAAFIAEAIAEGLASGDTRRRIGL